MANTLPAINKAMLLAHRDLRNFEKRVEMPRGRTPFETSGRFLKNVWFITPPSLPIEGPTTYINRSLNPIATDWDGPTATVAPPDSVAII
jgi:hypothetical protein